MSAPAPLQLKPRPRRLRTAAVGLAVAVLGAGALVGATAGADGPQVTVTVPLGGGPASAPGDAIVPGGGRLATTVSVTASVQSRASVLSALRAAGRDGARVDVGAPSAAPPVAPGFVGLSIEYQSMYRYARAGRLFDQLVQNLAPGQRPYLRVGGDSTDHTYWPVAGIASPGLRYELTPQWIDTVSGGTRALDPRMTFGLNMEANRPALATAEASALAAGFGPRLSAFELGNEPNLYEAFAWYAADGQKVKGRPPGWSVGRYLGEVGAFARALRGYPLWGPSIGNPPWMAALPQFTPYFSTITYHAYPTSCYAPAGSPQAPTVANLLAPTASSGLAAEIEPWVRYSAEHGRGMRIDEINTTACGGQIGTPNIVAALWALEAGFSFAEAGLRGVNVHTFGSARYRLFSLAGTGSHASASVLPEYYGWMMFARAAPPGSRVLQLTLSGNPHIKAYATRLGNVTHVVLINDAHHRVGTVALGVPGADQATVERLLAPGLLAKRGISFAGMSVPAHTRTGLLSGTPQVGALRGAGRFAVSMPAASAALLTLTP
jgi:hypothetical protein